MARFKKGEKCRVIKNLLSPEGIGQVVTILRIAAESEGSVLYAIEVEGMQGFAMERCLEKIKY